MTNEIDRRTFLRSAAVGGGGLLLGVWLTSCTKDDTSPTTAGPSTTTVLPSTSTQATTAAPTTTAIDGDPSAHFEPHLLLRIDGDGTVTVTVPKSEMGQGVRTSLAMIVAEELDADWSRVRVETAPGDAAYGDQVTGGSLSISTRYDTMRRVGATARHMLIEAAATRWGIAAAACSTEPHEVVERNGERRATYGSLAGFAAEVEPPSSAEVTLKDPSDYRIIGTPRIAIDAPNIVRGAAIYGSDVRLPNMVYAVVARSPVFGGRVATYDDTAARDVAGVVEIVEIASGLAVVAENTWAALQGRERLAITWDARGNDSLDDAAIRGELVARLDPVSLEPGELTADYTFPYFAHAALEPLTCVVDTAEDHCEVWAATQHPQLARAFAGRETSLPTDAVDLHIPMIGGGFGRRLEQDFIEEAAELAAAIRRPVKIFWSRTDDLRHDRYQPAAVYRAHGHPAEPSSIRLQASTAGGPVPTGPWRAVGNVPEAFAHESFVDELAFAAGRHPFEYRIETLGDRALGTLRRAADEAGWGEPLPQGWGRGIAHHATWNATSASAVAEISVQDGVIRLHRIVCAVDCGTVVNPDTVVAQIEGAVAFATTATLLGGVTITNGGVAEANFHDSPILRFDEMPEVEVHIVPSQDAPTGVGEAGVPPIAPAIANAVFAATGQRLRELPLRLT